MVAGGLLGRVSSRDGRAALLFALFTYVLFSLFDWVTTAVALDAGGTEGNPLAASVFSMFGSGGLLIFKVLVVAVIVVVLLWIPRRIMSLRVATWIAVVFAAVSAVIVISNVRAYGSLVTQHHGPTYHTTAPSARLIYF